MTATLSGSITDDGLPVSPGTTSALWTKVSGPGTVTFADNTAEDTSASFSSAGTYVLQLAGNDGELSSNDQVTIVVLPANVAPTVDAGVSIAITLPNTVTLDATISDDGYPLTPGTISTQWTQLSGLGVATFADSSAVDTSASFSTDGVYVLQLSANDGELITTDVVTITVAPEPTSSGGETGGNDEVIAPDVTPTVPSETGNPVLGWAADDNACNYQVHRSTTPYFTPSPTTALSGLLPSTATSYTDTTTGEGGYFYIVQAIQCSGGQANSDQSGVFNFELEPGQ